MVNHRRVLCEGVSLAPGGLPLLPMFGEPLGEGCLGVLLAASAPLLASSLSVCWGELPGREQAFPWAGAPSGMSSSLGRRRGKDEGVGLEELKCPEGSEETLLASPAGGAYKGHAAGGLGAAWVGSALSLEEAGRGWGAVSPGPWV